MSIQQLNIRLTPAVDYTRRDEITFSLLDVVTCPIKMEITSNMILFNHQFYDQRTWKSHDDSEARNNRKYN